jgi:UDPglucose 6-dehydrogenase
VLKSTVPVGTGARLEALLAGKCRHPIAIVSNPEFLKEGSAVDDFLRPDRVVIGAEDPEAGELVRQLYLPFVRNQRPILLMSRNAAELTKYAANGFLAARISFINEVANLCEHFDVDVNEVRMGIGTDARIGFQFLYPGLGYGGSCFPKDVRALAHVARSVGAGRDLLEAVHEVNETQKLRLFHKITRRFGQDLSGRTFAFWGISFKPNTDDIREAPALTLIDRLLAAGARVHAHDPQALRNLHAAYGEKISYHQDAYETLGGADALVICTEWNEFRSPDFERIAGLLRAPIVFDGRNLYELPMMRKAGFEYYSIGRPDAKASPDVLKGLV